MTTIDTKITAIQAIQEMFLANEPKPRNGYKLSRKTEQTIKAKKADLISSSKMTS